MCRCRRQLLAFVGVGFGPQKSVPKHNLFRRRRPGALTNIDATGATRRHGQIFEISRPQAAQRNHLFPAAHQASAKGFEISPVGAVRRQYRSLSSSTRSTSGWLTALPSAMPKRRRWQHNTPCLRAARWSGRRCGASQKFARAPPPAQGRPRLPHNLKKREAGPGQGVRPRISHSGREHQQHGKKYPQHRHRASSDYKRRPGRRHHRHPRSHAPA